MTNVQADNSDSTLGRLCTFWEKWTRASFAGDPEPSRVFGSVAHRTFDLKGFEHAKKSDLCSDGTPVEFSFAFDNNGRFALRFVCDLTKADLSDTEQRQWLRESADLVVPPDWSNSSTLDWLFERHLQGAHSASRFKVWHGAGFGAGGRRVGKLYFNTEWLHSEAVLDILHAIVNHEGLQILYDSALIQSKLGKLAIVGYDFDKEGLQRVKVYVRLPEFSQHDIDAAARQLCSSEFDAFRQLTGVVLGCYKPRCATNCLLSFGLFPRSGKRDLKVYLQLGVAGFATFDSLPPLLGTILARWGIEAWGTVISGAPSGFVPTLLSVGVSNERETTSLYFKPLLPPRITRSRTDHANVLASST